MKIAEVHGQSGFKNGFQVCVLTKPNKYGYCQIEFVNVDGKIVTFNIHKDNLKVRP